MGRPCAALAGCALRALTGLDGPEPGAPRVPWQRYMTACAFQDVLCLFCRSESRSPGAPMMRDPMGRSALEGAPGTCGRHDQGLCPCYSLYSSAPATFVRKSMAKPFLPLCLSACGMVSHTDTVVEPSEVMANATGKDLPLNVGLVVVSEALPVPSCALARVPAVAHTRPAGALRQRYGPHRRSTLADPCWPSCRSGPSSRRRAPDVPPQQPGAGIPGAQARPDAPAKQPGRADRP